MLLLVLFKRLIGKRGSLAETAVEATLEQLIEEVQAGDVLVRNQLLKDYQPFIAKIASKLCKRYIDPTRDDEYSVALSAFNEAMNHFSSNQSNSFLSFAETVIRRRLIDFIRREQKYVGQIPMTSFELEDDESNLINPVEIQQSVEQFKREVESHDRRTEIEMYSEALLEYGITMKDLVEGSPKHSDSRNMLLRIGRILAHDEALAAQLKEKKTLPIKDLLERVEVARKTLERNRKYIIAVAVIFLHDFYHLREYLYVPEEG